jgi:hypothetical protein
MTTEQPLALKLADLCETLSGISDAYDEHAYRDAAAELRRQHAEIEHLRLRLSLARYALSMLVETDKLDPWQCDLYDRAMLDNIAFIDTALAQGEKK